MSAFVTSTTGVTACVTPATGHVWRGSLHDLSPEPRSKLGHREFVPPVFDRAHGSSPPPSMLTANSLVHWVIGV